MTKRKKNARERRALVGALCTAAVIVAGSTFAWFTSSDEVTNRLSANADYNVSIVESFTPPNNWIPGQEVKKDVYATNTGNIPAFVKEEISGVLTITTERPVATFSDDCVKLTAEERYVMEAGSFLAYKPDGSNKTLGDQIVIRPDDQGTPSVTDFTPDAEGLYVFRRKIVVDGSRNETFEYKGYYYKGGNYYKISNLSVTADGETDLANDGVRTDGNLAAAVSGYYKEETKVVNPVDLAYDATGNKLVATYDTGINTVTQAEKDAAAAAYDTAIHDYQLALAKQSRAVSESTTADSGVANLYSAYQTAQQELDDALTALSNATTAKTNAQSVYDALVTEKGNLQTQKGSLENTMYGHSGGGTSAEGSGSNQYDTNSLYAQTVANIGTADDAGRLKTEVETWLSGNPSGVTHSTFETLTYDELCLYTPTSDTHTYYTDYVAQQKAIADYNAALTTYNSVNARLNEIGDDSTNSSEMYTAKQALDGATSDYDNAVTSVGDASSGKTKTRDEALAAYNAALTASGTQTSNLSDANDEVASTLAAYNAAKTAYEKAIAAPTASTLKININLSDAAKTTGGTAGQWQLLPTGDATTGALADNKAVFYYTSILDAGTTSSKLIESVELDSSVTKEMYKSFDFDLNVALDSVQVTYDSDNETILATGANDQFGKTATLTNVKDINTAISWS